MLPGLNLLLLDKIQDKSEKNETECEPLGSLCKLCIQRLCLAHGAGEHAAEDAGKDHIIMYSKEYDDLVKLKYQKENH